MRRLLTILFLLVAVIAYAGTTSTKFPGKTIPDTGDAATTWSDNLNAYLDSVDAELNIAATATTQLGTIETGVWNATAITGLYIDETTVDHDTLSNFVQKEHYMFSVLNTDVTATAMGTATVVEGQVDHDSLANFAANEHYTQANITALGTLTGNIVLEGSTPDDYETTIVPGNPGSDITLTLPSTHDATFAMVSGYENLKVTHVTPILKLADLTISAKDFAMTVDADTLSFTSYASGVLTVDNTMTVPDTTGTLALTSDFDTVAELPIVWNNGIAATNNTVNVDHDTADNYASNEHYTQANITELGTLTGNIVLEGSTPDDYETTIVPGNPGSDITLTLPSTHDATFAMVSGYENLKVTHVTPILKLADLTISAKDFAMTVDADTLSFTSYASGVETVDNTITIPDTTFTVVAPSYSSIWCSTLAITINTPDTYTLASAAWTQNEESGPSYVTTTGEFTVQTGGAGVYQVGMNLSFASGAADLIHCSGYIAGAEDEALEAERLLGTPGTDVGSMGWSNIVTLADAETFKLMCKSDDTNAIDISHGAMYMNRISH